MRQDLFQSSVCSVVSQHGAAAGIDFVRNVSPFSIGGAAPGGGDWWASEARIVGREGRFGGVKPIYENLV